MNVVTELILTGALLVKNCLGAVAVVALLLAGAGPVIHYGVLSLSYRFLAAAAQPVSDKRIVGCLGTMGEGCAMLLRIMITAEVMCILTFVILMASVVGKYGVIADRRSVWGMQQKPVRKEVCYEGSHL